MHIIDYFFSLGSPFTYLAGDRLEQIAAKRGARIVYRPSDIQAVLEQTGGVPVGQRHPARQAYRLQELRRLSVHAGMPINLKPAFWPVDARPASLAVIQVDQRGGDAGEAARAFLSACWAEERDIADPATISQILGELGHDGEVSETETQDIWASNTALALESGVFGAPFYVVGDERFWGQDRLEFLDRYLAQE